MRINWQCTCLSHLSFISAFDPLGLPPPPPRPPQINDTNVTLMSINWVQLAHSRKPDTHTWARTTLHTHSDTHTREHICQLIGLGAINLTDTPTLKCGRQNSHWQAHTHIYKVAHRSTCIHTHTTHTHTHSCPANTLRKVEPFANFAYNSRKMTGNCWREAELAVTLYIFWREETYIWISILLRSIFIIIKYKFQV